MLFRSLVRSPTSYVDFPSIGCVLVDLLNVCFLPSALALVVFWNSRSACLLRRVPLLTPTQVEKCRNVGARKPDRSEILRPCLQAHALRVTVRCIKTMLGRRMRSVLSCVPSTATPASAPRDPRGPTSVTRRAFVKLHDSRLQVLVHLPQL